MIYTAQEAGHQAHIENLERKLAEQEARIQRLREALEFYADRWTYYKRLKDGSRAEDFQKFEMLDRDHEKIIEDWNGQNLVYNFTSPGKRARKALEADQAEEGK